MALFGGHGGGRADRFEDHYTSAQEKALRDLIGQLRDDHGPLKVTGHNRYSAKACPCFDVARWLKGKGPRSSATQSRTVQASTAQIVAGSCAGVSAVAGLDGSAQIVAIGLAGMIILAALWILRERLAKWSAGDR